MASKLRRGEGNVQPYTLSDGSVRYSARWYDNGRIRSKSFHTEADAHAFLIGLATDKRLDRHIPVTQITVMEACQRYLKQGADRWSTNTQASYRQVAQSHVYPHIGTQRIAELTTSKVQQWIDKLARKGLSGSVIGNAKIVLNGTCADLVRLGDLQRNPVTGVRLPARKKRPFTVWDETQVREVLRHAEQSHPQMAVYYRVALTTGMRPGEIRALMWHDIDFDKGVITCKRTITRDANFRQMVGSTTKTHKARTIAVPASTIAALHTLRREQLQRRLAHEYWAATDLVFDRGDGHMLAQQSLRNRHLLICKAAGVPPLHFHGLRHQAATMMLNAGTNLKVVSEVLGHSSLTITADIYMHVSVDMQRAATDLLGDILDRKV